MALRGQWEGDVVQFFCLQSEHCSHEQVPQPHWFILFAAFEARMETCIWLFPEIMLVSLGWTRMSGRLEE